MLTILILTTQLARAADPPTPATPAAATNGPRQGLVIGLGIGPDVPIQAFGVSALPR